MKTFVLLLAVLAMPLAQADAPPLVTDAVQVDQMPAAPAPGLTFADKLKTFASPEQLGALLGVLATLGTVAKLLTDKRKRIVALVVKNAFYASEDAANETTDPNFNKLAAALKSADAWCLAHGWRTLTPGEQAIATLQLQAQHGEEIAKQKVAAAAPAEVPT